jgi:sugar O-acyltransferase (sialic acid O-acetyltransferase NeuD family)
MDKKICIIGSSGFAKEVYWLLRDCGKGELVDCFMVPDQYWEETTVLDLPVKKQSEFNAQIHSVVLGIGDPKIRRKVVYEQLIDAEYPTIIHPSSKLSDWVELSRGTIICAGNIITCDIKIGEFATINLNCTIGHDCTIGSFFTLNPAVNVSGLCKFGDDVYIGTNASVKQGVNICSDVVIGMGAVVIKNISEPGTYVGSPAKKLIV